MTIDDDGRPKIILFLAHWCPHCQAEVPVVQEWVDAGGLPEGMDLYAVSTAMDPARENHPASAWLEREGWTEPVLVDDDRGSAGTAFGLTSFPYWVFVDAGGNVVNRYVGSLTAEQIDAAVQTLG